MPTLNEVALARAMGPVDGVAALADYIDQAVAGYRNRAQRSHRYTWAPSLWATTTALGVTGAGQTHAYTIGIPDDFSAIRVGFLNMTATPWTVSKVAAVASSTWSDYVIPTGGATPITLTFGAGGADDSRIYSAAGLPTTIAVAANAADATSGATDIAAITWSDWCPIQSQPADPATGMRVLMLRGLTPATAVTVTGNRGNWPGYSGGNGGNQAANNGYDIFVGGIKTLDRVTVPFADGPASAGNTAAYLANNPTIGTIFAVVQAITKNEGVTIVQAGESKFFGTTTATQMTNWALRSVGQIGDQAIGVLPVGCACLAVGGYDSAHTFGLARSLLPSLLPSIVNVCSYNGNENDAALGYTDAFSQQVEYGRTMMFRDFIRSLGGVPILVSPLPMVQFGATQADSGLTGTPANPGFQAAFAAWKALAAEPATATFDAYSVLGANYVAMDPHYGIAGISTDGNHPNDAGHGLLVPPYVALVKPLIGL